MKEREVKGEIVAQEELLQFALEVAGLGYWELDTTTQRASRSANHDQIFGHASPLPEWTYPQFLSHVHEEDRERVDTRYSHALETGQDWHFQCRIHRADDGQMRWIEAHGRHFRDSQGKAVRIIGTVADITERKRLEQEREQLLAEATARAEREVLVNRIGTAVRDALPDPDAMQAALVEWLGTALRADRCFLTVVDAAHDAFTIGRDYRSDDAALLSLAGTYRLSDFTDDLNALYGSSMSDSGPSLMVFNDTQSALNNDVPLERRTAAAIAGLGLRSVVNVAVYEGSMLVAALGVGMAFAPRDWTAHEVQLIADMAVQARAAVEAARLQKRERNIAQTLQAALQPPAPDDLPGLALDGVYLPALAEAGVGGDFYDVFPVEKGCTALVVSDLSGKGLAAASEVATVRNMVRYAIYSGHTLAEAMADLDRILVEHRLLTGFATLFVGLYDQNERTVTYVNCGQEPALIWQAETGEVEMLPPTAPVLGSFAAGNGFTEASVALTVGDVFAAFTDGLTDVGPNRRHLLDVDGVADLLRDCCIDLRSGNPRSIVNCLMVGVHAFGQGVAASDDIALLVGVVGGGGIANKEGGIPGDQA